MLNTILAAYLVRPLFLNFSALLEVTNSSKTGALAFRGMQAKQILRPLDKILCSNHFHRSDTSLNLMLIVNILTLWIGGGRCAHVRDLGSKGHLRLLALHCWLALVTIICRFKSSKPWALRWWRTGDFCVTENFGWPRLPNKLDAVKPRLCRTYPISQQTSTQSTYLLSGQSWGSVVFGWTGFSDKWDYCTVNRNMTWKIRLFWQKSTSHRWDWAYRTSIENIANSSQNGESVRHMTDANFCPARWV